MNTLCQSCKYFDYKNQYLKCAVNPSLPKDCKDFESKAMEPTKKLLGETAIEVTVLNTTAEKIFASVKFISTKGATYELNPVHASLIRKAEFGLDGEKLQIELNLYLKSTPENINIIMNILSTRRTDISCNGGENLLLLTVGSQFYDSLSIKSAAS